MADTARPLSGVRVLELARILAGPWTGQTLADLGARVIKVERRGSGDDTRAWGPPFVESQDQADRSAAYFHSANRGKMSIALDFDDPADLDIVQRLALQADVVIENFKVGGLTQYGLDHETVTRKNPSVVYCSITGFGQTGPYAARAGYDLMIQGMGGIMDLTGAPDGEPQKIGVALADIMTGVYASVGILAALMRRQTTNCGGYVDMSLLDTQVAVLANQAMNFLVSGRAPRRLGNAHPNIVPYQLFPASDGQILIATGNDRQFQSVCDILGLTAAKREPRFATNAGRVEHRDVLVSMIAAETAKQTSGALLDQLERLGVPAGPVNSLDKVFANPQVVARAMRYDLPRRDGTTIPSVRGPIVLDGVPCVADAASPALGEHDNEIRQALSRGCDPWAVHDKN